MQQVWEFIQHLVHPKSIIEYGGLTLLLVVIFAETGLFFGFFLPGDSLLFIAGLLCATSEDVKASGGHALFDVSLYVLIPSLFLAATAGNFVGYLFGLRAGNVLMHREDTFFFKKKYIHMASDFYHERGGLALILGRFIPIIRTFVPIFAGIVKIDLKTFAVYNIVGGALWVSLVTLVGYFLGKRWPKIGDHLEIIVVLLIVVSIIPVILTYLRNRMKERKGVIEQEQPK